MKRLILFIFMFSINFFCFSQQALPRLGVVTFDVNDESNLTLCKDAIAISNIIRSNIVKSNKYEVITREKIDKLIKEQRIQTSSISSKENIAKLKLANIKYLVVGNVDLLGDTYAVSMSVLNVANGKFEFADSIIVLRYAQIIFSEITSFTEKFILTFDPSEKKRVKDEPPPPPPKLYKVGDYGPSGGYVFYDKGIFSNGWRYLEASPSEFEFSAEWGTFSKNVFGTEHSLGSGKKNTQVILNALKGSNDVRNASKLIFEVIPNSSNEWFLPSKDELNLMYINLCKKNLGNFKNGDYWSSSQLSENWAWCQSFKHGEQIANQKNGRCYVRPVRAF